MSKNKAKEKVNKKIVFIRAILIILIALWAIMVFNFSNQNGSQSSGLSRKVVQIFIKDEQVVDIVEPYARKAAHFSEYAFGGGLFILLFSTYKWTDRKKMTVSIILGIWYAALDEIHQLLVANRHGSVFDVYLDTLGFATGVCAMLLLIKIIQSFKGEKK